MVILKELIFKFLLWEGVVVLKELIFNSFYFKRVWWSWKNSFLTVSALGDCNDRHALYDDKCLDYVSKYTCIDSAIKCVIITSVCI